VTEQTDFKDLWNDYLEGDITDAGMVKLQEHFARDEQLLQDSVDSFQIHRLLGYESQDDDQHEAFVKSTMSQLVTDQEQTLANNTSVSRQTAAARDGRLQSRTKRTPIAAFALAASILVVLVCYSIFRVTKSPAIAQTMNVHGTIEWTHENGMVEVITETNQSLTGGTLETMTGDSTVTMQFTDGTIVTLDGLSLLTVSDQGQKILRLKRGNLSADVQPQPNLKPMMVFTDAAELRVVGTQFNVNARNESTKLTVNEGEVLLKRRTDGESVNVIPHHQVVASLRDARQLKSIKRADQIHSWKCDLQSETSYGTWFPIGMELAIELKQAVANGEMTQAEAVKAYKKAASLTDQQGRAWALPSRFGLSVVVSVNQQATMPVVLKQRSRIRITGRGYSATDLVVGITTNKIDGGFSGKFQQGIDLAKLINPETQEFTIDIPVETMAPSNSDFPVSPIGSEFVACWCSHPTNKVTKLELTSVEIIDVE